ncbi:protein mono-ADP-ribosyltransferase PARP14-like isoform X1 [Embiotoca jacksoni]|uniref:protein mono-ADP-ribosyltransferase PARP14-like isoform X1 n=1 Tax=Embiotoca jacksoni TaxID=100190 RepID=UPI003703BFBE
MEEYRHSLFFEAKDLTSKEKETIRRHFQKRRESGGGECGQIEKVGSNIYKICFKEKEDQERVLSKKFHTVKLPGGEQRLTVSQTSSSQIPEQIISQPLTFAKANNKSLEKIFKVDIFLLYYLRDDTKAYRVFQKQLSLIGCTVEFDFVEEWAVVRGDIEKGPGGAAGGAAETWEIQVDRVFISLTENYICHHVLEPKQVKALLQDASFATDDIRVYTQSSYPVVVGEAEAVRKKITNLEKSQQTLKKLPVVEKQLKLVEEEFSQEMRTHYPDVKVLRQNAMIILDGPDKEVQSGAAKLDELIKKIKEKKVQLPTALLTFVTVSSAVSKYQTRFRQNLRNPVSIEVGSDLVLSSLSSDALEEAEAAVLRDLAVATVKLQGAAAVPPNLDRVKEILLKAKNEVNRVELRVDVSFLPAEVGLAGYSDNVNKLKEILHDFQMNQVLTQEVLNLPQAELVDCFDTLLKLFGMKESEVTIKASHFPNPCVLVAGPRCQVQETQQFLMSALGSLTSDTLVFDGPGAQRYFQADGKVSKELVESSCRVLIREQKAVHSPSVKTKPRSVSSPVSIMARPSRNRSRFNTVGSSAVNKTILKIKIGSLEDEQVNVLVAPMVNKQLTSTNIGASLSKKAGHTLKAKFVTAAATGTFVPRDVLQVDAPPSLGCSKIFFIECLPWDGVRGRSMQALGNGLKRCVDLCVQQHLSSVAFPVIGPGLVLKYPLREAIQVLTETIVQFGLSASPGSLSTIHVVIKPGYPDSEECYHDVYNYLSSHMNHGGQVIFRSLTSDLDDITVIVGGGVKLQLVFGDITNETTDAVVNTTDFKNFEHDGVCKDILTIAGPEVVAELKAAQVVRRGVFGSQAGRFPCKRILHVCGEKDAGVIEQLMCGIVGYCESFRFKSVAIPAICAGTGGLDPGVVAGAILRGIKAATSTRLYSLEDIRIVLIKIDVFLAFKEEAMQMFSTTVVNTSDSNSHKLPSSLPQLPPVQPPPSASADMSSLQTSAAARQSAFLFLGLRKQDVDDAKEKFENLCQTQCLTQTFKKEELEALTQDEMEDLKRLVDAEGLYVKEEPVGSFKVSGLKDGVNEAARMINVSQQDNLRRAMRVREEEDLYTRVVWCIMGRSGTWERLPKTANHDLEHKVARVMVDSQGDSWVVDLQTMQAVETITGLAMKLKRLENLPDFALPLYWDSMAANEMIKVVALQPSSAEYRTVKELFKRTSTKSVVKIERLQNVHLRRVYEAQKKHISDKNTQQGGAGEKFLYHGTTQDNCDAIMKTGFNRRFAGQNATLYGHGTYFAVKAAYSANPTYSKPAADGSQLMFVARVLTGVYTKGSGDMKVPPPRDPQQPHDLYDSAVDATDNPTMYVVFHDNQACPDYLITFQ